MQVRHTYYALLLCGGWHL